MSYDAELGGPGYIGETPIESVHATPDGGLDFTTGGSLDANAAIFKAFVRERRLGVVQTRDRGRCQDN